MDSFQIAIIHPNKLDSNKLKKIDVSYKDIEDSIKNIIEFRDVTKADMMDHIVEITGIIDNLDLMGTTTMVYEDATSVYQLCHLDMEQNGGKNNIEQLNELSTILSRDKEKIYGRAVFLSSRIREDMLCDPISVKLDEIIELTLHKIKHIGLKINADNTVEEITYLEYPLENYDEDRLNNMKYECIEVPFLKFNFLLIFPTNSENKDTNLDKINKNITKIVGIHRVYGDCYLVSKSSQVEYIDIDKKLYEKIKILAEDRLETRDLKDDEKYDGSKKDRYMLVQNRYSILEKRLKEVDNNYNKIKDYVYICTGCYRARYETLENQKNDWSKHKSDCLYNTLGLHEKIKVKK